MMDDKTKAIIKNSIQDITNVKNMLDGMKVTLMLNDIELLFGSSNSLYEAINQLEELLNGE